MRKISDYRFEGIGLKNRLAQMFNPESGRTVLLAVDHGYFQGAPGGLEDLRATIEPLLPYCDAISPTIGGLKCLPEYSRTPVILRATGGNSMTREKELDDEIITLSVDEMLRANAIGFTASVYIGQKHQRQTIKNLTDLTNEAHKYGLISIGITAKGSKLEEMFKKDKKETLRFLEHACRVVSENGADIIKTYYCEGFKRVVESCLSPIVIAGGKKQETKDALDFTYKAIKAGAVGVDMGRNIFQNKNPVAMIQAVRAIVHGGETAQEAYKFYKSLCRKK